MIRHISISSNRIWLLGRLQRQSDAGGKDRISLSPNGNGGWFSSLCRAGYLKEMQEKGIEWLSVFSVDNVLQRINDPVYVGAVIASGCDCGGKVVRKVSRKNGSGYSARKMENLLSWNIMK